MLKSLIGWTAAGLLVVCCTAYSSTIHAAPLASPNFRFEESSIGSGSFDQANSPNFQAEGSSGATAVGQTSSENFQAEAGPETTNDPTLSLAIDDSDADFGSFTPTAATMTTSTFSVSNYTSYGYVVQLVGEPPSNGNHTLDAMATPDFSQPGIEQFGINLVANTMPLSVGTNPDQEEFGEGVAAPNYATSNEYRYVSGETIALAPKSSGKTVYTISYLVNVGALTPGGQYKSGQTLIVTGSY